jgi:hypothetical protein
MAALNYKGLRDAGGRRVWEFSDENDRPYYTEDSTEALELGAPVRPDASEFQAPQGVVAERAPDPMGAGGYTPQGAMLAGATAPGMTPDIANSSGSGSVAREQDAQVRREDQAAKEQAASTERTPVAPPNLVPLKPSEAQQGGGQMDDGGDPYFDKMRGWLRSQPIVSGGGRTIPGRFNPDTVKEKQIRSADGQLMPAGPALAGNATELRNREIALAEHKASTEAKQLDMASKQTQIALIQNRIQQQKDETEAMFAEQAKKRKMAELSADRERTWAQQVDPDRRQKLMSDGSRFVAALAIGLGALGSAMSGSGENQALKILKEKNDKDIRVQEQAIDSSKEAWKMRDNEYAQLLADGEDPKFIRDRLEIRKLEEERMRTELSQYASQLQSLGINLEEYKLGIDKALNDKYGEYAEKFGADYTEKYEKERHVGGADPMKQFMQHVAGEKALNELSGEAEGEDATIIRWRGQPVFKMSKSSSAHKPQTVQENLTETSKGVDAIEDLKHFIRSWDKLDADDKRDVKIAAERVKAALRVPILGPGTQQQAEYMRLDDVVSNPEALIRLSDPIRGLSSLQKMIVDDASTYSEDSGGPTLTYEQRGERLSN